MNINCFQFTLDGIFSSQEESNDRGNTCETDSGNKDGPETGPTDGRNGEQEVETTDGQQEIEASNLLKVGFNSFYFGLINSFD